MGSLVGIHGASGSSWGIDEVENGADVVVMAGSIIGLAPLRPGGLEMKGCECGLEERLRDGAVERADPHLIVHVHAGGAAADGIHARKLRGGAAQRILDAIEVMCGSDWAKLPGSLIAPDGAALPGARGALAIAGAEVEADAAAIQVAAQRSGGLALPGERHHRPRFRRRTAGHRCARP